MYMRFLVSGIHGLLSVAELLSNICLVIELKLREKMLHYGLQS